MTSLTYCNHLPMRAMTLADCCSLKRLVSTSIYIYKVITHVALNDCELFLPRSSWGPPLHPSDRRGLLRPVRGHRHHRLGDLLLHETAGEAAGSKIDVQRLPLTRRLRLRGKKKKKSPDVTSRDVTTHREPVENRYKSVTIRISWRKKKIARVEVYGVGCYLQKSVVTPRDSVLQCLCKVNIFIFFCRLKYWQSVRWIRPEQF